jgi:serine/threonine protein kinase
VANCPSGHQNPEGHMFCGHCGTAILAYPQTCPNGHANPPGQIFCGHCGTPLVPTPPPQPNGLAESSDRSPVRAQVIDRAKLGALTKIGQGGQGVVYAAPKVTTKFAASMVFKEYKTQALAGIDFTALAAMPALVEDTLTYEEAERLISIAAWPCALVDDDARTTGFVMPAIPDDFFIELTTVKGVSSTTAEFQHLLNHQTVLNARGIDIDDVQRFSLLREVASALAFLHTHGVSVGDVSPKNLLFCLTPDERVYFIDCDAVRINDVSALPQVETPGWEAPSGEELATIYTDSYKLGLLALRLLAGDQHTVNPRHLSPSTPDLLRQVITDTLTKPPHQRPLPQAWTYVLGHAIEHTQHSKQTPAVAPDTAAPPEVPVVRTRPSARAASPKTSSEPKSTMPVRSAAPPAQAPPPGQRITSTGGKILSAMGAVRISTKLRIGNSVEIRVPGDDHDGQVGRIVELFSYEPGVIVKFSGDPDPYAFQRNELELITQRQSRKTTATTQPTYGALYPGSRVKVRVPDDDHDGQVGRIVEIFSSDPGVPGVIVRFKGDPDPYAFQRNELELIAHSEKR